MSRYQPPFTITPPILNVVIEIGELLGHWAAQTGRASSLLRKENRIRTIQASLAIEHNSLSAEQVTAIMDGKRVLAPAKDIQEVRNAILAYDHLSSWGKGRLSDLLSAHRILMAGLVDNPGNLRQNDVGIYRDRMLIHMAPPASQVSRLVSELLNWLDSTDLHPLIASSVFHYEFEFIRPFADGNGRMGRLWQTLILSTWRPEMAWLPVETLIHYQQERYYQVLGECDRASDCTLFIQFMLGNIAAALKEGLNSASKMSEEMSEETSEEKVLELSPKAQAYLVWLRRHPTSTIADMATRFGVTTRTVERQLQTLQKQGRLERIGSTKGGYWRLID